MGSAGGIGGPPGTSTISSAWNTLTMMVFVPTVRHDRSMAGSNNISEYMVGTRGSTNCADLIYGPNGDVIWEYEGEKPNPYAQEHTDLVRAIRTGEPINEARQVAESTLTGIMGRVSAYSGETVNREEFLNSSLRLGPTEYKWGGVSISEKMAIPGQPAGPPRDV